MSIEETAVSGAFRIVPERFPDHRGVSLEMFKSGALTEVIGHPFRIGQFYCSTSRRNTLRGIHSTALPPGQEKIVTCVRGAVLDVVVDLRVGSPGFGQFDVTAMDGASGVSVYLADGLGHAFLTLTDDACMAYLCSTEYVHGTMIEVNALDSALRLPWGLSEPPIMSAKDAAAPSLAEAQAAGLLPGYEECLTFAERLAHGDVLS
ncbi:dTDP-4-dehydrorhamnose 3,5-epimerase [Micromonospora sp. NPDC047548]|uniref:dTDP-4-dehydrorhamnose 3,5-epimerase family protein n=1 Tax=Micromonospora sp. NPDC047548 TaxID=3155624 RepID=UPI0033E59EE6